MMDGEDDDNESDEVEGPQEKSEMKLNACPIIGYFQETRRI